jgi:hypothetical protein
MTDQQQWDAAATEAGYQPVSDYVERWATARHEWEQANEAHIAACNRLNDATINYHIYVNAWLKAMKHENA